MPNVRIKPVQRNDLRPVPWRGVAMLCVALFAWINVLAVSHELHELVSGHESSAANHHCAATLLSHGQVAPACPTVEAPAPIVSATATPTFELAVWAPVDYRFSPSRAPPVFPA